MESFLKQIRGTLTQYPVVANLIIINVILLLATWVAKETFDKDLIELLGLHYPASPFFRPYQIVTHIFMHGGLTHLFFNMYALWLFGRILENQLGGKRFLFFYLFTGLGAAGVHTLVNYFEFTTIQNQINLLLTDLTPDSLDYYVSHHFPQFRTEFHEDIIEPWLSNPTDPQFVSLARRYLQDALTFQLNIPTVGASGAVYGILLAFGMLYPNVVLYLLIPPIPIKAKWFVIIYAAIELYLGISQPGSNIAHFAHLGGMIFGLILILYWRKYGSRI